MADDKTYRCFVTRHYIAVEGFDVKASSPAKARQRAVAAAKRLVPDPRLAATDNKWHGDDPIEIDRPGFPQGKSSVTDVGDGVYWHKT